MNIGWWSKIAGASLTLAAASALAACRPQVSGADTCSKQIEELRAEVRRLEANVAHNHHDHGMGNGDLRREVLIRERRLNEELEADIKKNGSDDPFAANIRSRFGVADPNGVRCGHEICRIDINFPRYRDASAFTTRMLVGCSAVWHGRFAVAKAANLMQEPTSTGPFPFSVFLYKPEEQPPADDVPCDSREASPLGAGEVSTPTPVAAPKAPITSRKTP